MLAIVNTRIGLTSVKLELGSDLTSFLRGDWFKNWELHLRLNLRSGYYSLSVSSECTKSLIYFNKLVIEKGVDVSKDLALID